MQCSGFLAFLMWSWVAALVFVYFWLLVSIVMVPVVSRASCFLQPPRSCERLLLVPSAYLGGLGWQSFPWKYCSRPVLSGGSFLVPSWLWQGSGASVAPGFFTRIGRRAATACLGVVRVAKANPIRLLVRRSVGTLILVTGRNFPNSVSMSSSVVE